MMKNEMNEVEVWASPTGLNINTASGIEVFPTTQAAVNWLIANGAEPLSAAQTVQRAVARDQQAREENAEKL